MTLAIQELGRRAHLTFAEVDAFLAEQEFPLVEGTTVTFVWRGEADAVSVRHWIHGLASTQPLVRLAGTDLWSLALELTEGSRVEYKLEVVQGPRTQLVMDPLNPLIDDFQHLYNTFRPHGALQGLTPAQYLARHHGLEPPASQMS